MTSPVEQIRAEIEKLGVIPFARFMELALYCPLCGYYEKKEDTPGKRGDFYTSVSVGPLFGELLAFQFAEWFEQSAVCGPQSKLAHATAGDWAIVEAGAHDGQLARDILTWLQRQRPALFARLAYRIIETSRPRQAWQRETLAPFAEMVHWHNHLPRAATQNSGPRTAAFTVVFSNELLDAFPVHRIGWDAAAKRWFEWGVTLRGEDLIWQRFGDPMHGSRVTLHAPPELLSALPDGFTTEVCPAAESWWRDAAASLQSGKLVTFDYGLEAEDYFAPVRANGTLRAYRHHRLADDVLADPGQQDLTAHVNFTALKLAGESAGCKTEAIASQAQFLTRIAARAWQPGAFFGEWTRDRTRQFQTLTHPEFLGRAFKVLIQSREERSS